MRAHPIRRSPIRAGLSFGLVVVAGIAASFAACADAVHLDPPGPGTDGGATSTGSGAGACHSNPDCAYPKPVCDAVSRKCVQCLTFSDCGGMPGTVCSKGACVCPSTTTPLTYCAGETPTCVDTQTSDTNCGTCGKVCSTNCVKGKCTSLATSSSSSSGMGGAGGSGTGGSGTGGIGTGGSGTGGDAGMGGD